MEKHGDDYPSDSNLSDEDFAAMVERERDDRYLDFAAVVIIGAQAIHDKRRLQAELADMTEQRNKWRKLCDEGDRARGSILGDLMVGLASGVLTVDRSKPLPERFKEKA
jgi:hypothetical protein